MKKKCYFIVLPIVLALAIILCIIVNLHNNTGADIGRVAYTHTYVSAADTKEDISGIYPYLSIDSMYSGTKTEFVSHPRRDPVPLQSYSEDPSGFVTRCYQILMYRDPDEEGLNYWREVLTSGDLSARDLICALMSSNEFISIRRPPEDIIYDLYILMDEDGPGDDTQPEVDCLKAHMSDGYIVDSIAKKGSFTKTCDFYHIPQGSFEISEERDINRERTSFVTRNYSNCLGRNPDIGGLNYWCGLLGGEVTASEILQLFVFGSEYYAYHDDNVGFVITLYNVMLGRDPSDEECTSWVYELDHTCTREHAFNSFLLSDEFGSICSDAGMNRGEPVEEPDGTIEWQDNIRFLELINEERKAAELDELATREDLWKDVAGIRASELKFPFSHQRPDGRSCFSTLSDAKMYHYSYAAELIAQGRSLTPEETIALWVSSPEHADIIKDPDVMYVATGSLHPQVGSKTYYCQYYLRK